jgi:signal transduction histidine kinase
MAEDPERLAGDGNAVDRRMADLSAFADGLVHDLRNPLNVIRTNVYLLRQKVTDADPKAVRAIERIDDQVGHAIQLLNGVQAYYRADRPTLGPVRLGDLVRQVVATQPVPDGCHIECSVAPDLPELSGDPAILDPAVRALLRNAVEALSGGGTVHLSARVRDGNIEVEVRDAGGGIAEEVRARAFEPFYTTRRAHAGLGLPLARKVARAHGGDAWLDVAPGEGTTAILRLPVG